MARLPLVLLLALLVSNTYATESTSTPVNNTADSEASSAANDAISNSTSLNDALSNDALSNVALASSASNIRKVEPFTFPKRGERPDPLYRASQLAFVGSIMADLGTTWSVPKGRTEGNPLLGRSKAQQVSVSSALALFTLWEAHSLHVRGNTRAAKYLLFMGSIAHAFAGAYNTR
jgi:hypothetical protein